MTLQVEQVYAGCTRLRLELADCLGTLSASQLDTPSLCSESTDREVAGHLAVSFEGSPQPFETLLNRFRASAHKRLKGDGRHSRPSSASLRVRSTTTSSRASAPLSLP